MGVLLFRTPLASRFEVPQHIDGADDADENAGLIEDEQAMDPERQHLMNHLLGFGWLLSNIDANIAGPGGNPMFLHADQSFAPPPWPPWPMVANAMWMLDDFTDENGATRVVNDFETIGVTADLEPTINVLLGRLYEGLGRNEDALSSYRSAAISNDRRAAAQGRLREIVLASATGGVGRNHNPGPAEIWKSYASNIVGAKALPCGHYLSEEAPAETYRELRDFFSAGASVAKKRSA